jgi:hypothetical protein
VARVDFAHLGPTLRVAAELVGTLAAHPDLRSARASFPEAYAAAYGGLPCASQD